MNTATETRNTRKEPTPEVERRRFTEITREMVDRFFERRCALALCIVNRHDITEIITVAIDVGRVVGRIEGYADGIKAAARAIGR